MKKTKILALLLALSLCLSLSPVVGVSASEITPKDTTTVTSASKSNMYLDANAEKKAFEKKYGKSKVKLDVNNPITITLDDGTKVEYSLKIATETTLASSNVLYASSTTSSYQTFSVSKKYLGGIFNNVTVSCNARCNFGYRSVQINDVWSNCDTSDATLSNTANVIEEAYGDNYSYASCYSRGTVSRSDVIGSGSANFFLHMYVDAAGAAYLASDSY